MEPVELIDRLRDIVVAKRRSASLCDAPQEAKKHAAPHGSFGGRKRPQRFLSYMALMSHIIDSEPFTYEEVVY